MTEKTKEQWYDECVALHESGRLKEAVSELENLIGAWPDYPLAHLALAVYHSELGNHEEMLSQMKTACSLEQEDPFYYTAFSALAIKSGKREEAEEALQKAQEAALAAYLKNVRAQSSSDQADNGSNDKE